MSRRAVFAILALLGLAQNGPASAQAIDAAPRPPNPSDSSAKVSVGPTLDQIIGQMIIVGFNGVSSDDPGVVRVLDWLGRGQIGGVILHRDNIVSMEQVQALTAELRIAGRRGPGLMPFIMVDQEGGKISRLLLRNGFIPLPSAQAVARSDPEEAYKRYRASAAEMARAGINVNLGPVVDLNVNPRNPIIGRLQRSFGNDPATVVQYAQSFIDAHHAEHILTVAKHFPGHGSSFGDSHLGAVDVSTTWKLEELAPYTNIHPDMVMVGHIKLRTLDDQDVPASLSPDIIGNLLRKTLRFDGIVIADDLDMRAISSMFPRVDAAIRALAAGNDLILVSSLGDTDPSLPLSVIHAAQRAVQAGKLSQDGLRASYNRIAGAKGKFVEPRPDGMVAPSFRGPLN